MTNYAWSAVAPDTVHRWSADAIHDTVAAIARQPAYSTSIRQSLLGRFLRFLFDRLSDLRALLSGSPGVRLTVIVAVALVVIVIIARVLVARRIEETRARARGGRGADGRLLTDYWSRARALARDGDHAAACHALYAAVLEELTRGGGVRFHPSKTSGDYARELARRGAPMAPAFLAFARQFERIVFGTDVVAAEDFDHLVSAAERVAPARVAA